MILIGVVYRVKSKGANTDPWGTPKVRSASEDKQSSSLILWQLPVRYDLNQSSAFPVTPNQSSSLLNSMVNGIKGSRKVKQNQCCDSAIVHWRENIVMDLKKGSFSRVKYPICILIMIWWVWTIYVGIETNSHDVLKNFRQRSKIGHWAVVFQVILIEIRHFR